MDEFWYGYIKRKTNDIYKDIAGDIETRLATSNYELEILLLKKKKKK